jgi:hypothetical protein
MVVKARCKLGLFHWRRGGNTVKKIMRADDGNNVYESDVNIGDVHDELEGINSKLASLNARLESAFAIAGLLGGIIVLILLAQTVRHLVTRSRTFEIFG